MADVRRSRSRIISDSHDGGRKPQRRAYRLIDLFAGAGGFTLGFTQTARFASVFANDFNSSATETYRQNFGPHCQHGAIESILEDPRNIPRADVVIGGPPCQGFSLLNKKKDGDPRKQMWRHFMRVVEIASPRMFVMENVPELLRSHEFLEIAKASMELGFKIAFGVLNAADFGVPQRRKRAFIIGSRVRQPELPQGTHASPKERETLFGRGKFPWRTVRDVLGDLPAPIGTEPRVGAVEPPMDLHFHRTPTRMSVQRYKCVPEGGNRVDLLRARPDLTPKCWVNKKGGTDLFGRLWWDRPAFTIRTEFFKPEKGRYLHPGQDRPITHREAARLMSFPDDFVFKGTKIEIAKQIGNAVPPLLGRRVAESVLAVLEGRAAEPRRAPAS